MLQSSPLENNLSHSISPQSSENMETRQSLAPPILIQYWQIVLRWKWVIVGIVLASLVAGLVVTLLMTPKYTATARIEISREQKNITKVDGLESPSAGKDLEFYQTQYSLISARSVAERVSRTLRLSSNDAFFKAHGVKANSNSIFSDMSQRPMTPIERDKREQLAIQLLLKGVTVAPVRGSSLTRVTIRVCSKRA